ncbi:Bug family tripartite tricarboxylate transporter substrate binding protein [Hydrogenophaga sp. BPS33]|uniref:Bug family tripartite tricarboxylate transporter substrate binding protein n=1 Tax=Hydrogenophaga sp. BPS33 TaxID=2651974 RepID=UPI00131F5A6D|nr:tripartite tricarboxylate transporter substrate binding protein [Hydrogenophaga sp. BPS33]QHE83909.1 tripartite tricarboxylate transporter substrate binding protein [Hydrogenophaga sp. BPS33]
MHPFSKSLLAGLALFAAIAPAHAQADYPKQPIKLVVGFAPGGGTDILARMISVPLAQRLGQPVTVDNKPGASGTIANMAVKNAPTDGYTLLIGASGAMTINPAVQADLPYHPINDYEPITVLGTYPIVFSTKPDLPVTNTRELIAKAKAVPGGLNSGGAGVLFQLTGELLNQQAGMTTTYVAYRGTAPAVTAILGGEIDMLIADIAPTLPLIESKRIRPIAITSAKRSKNLPDVPTLAESGLPGFDVDVFVGLFARKGTPKPIVDRLQREIAAIVASEDIQQKMEKMGISPSGITPQQTAALVQRDLAKYTEAARRGNIKVD